MTSKSKQVADNDEVIPAHKEKEIIEQETVDITVPVVKEVEFDWNVSKRGANQYSKEKAAELENLYNQTFKQVEDNEIIKAIVSGITTSDVILNIGFKSDGMIARSEFKDTPDLKVGDEIDVYVENKENKKGQLVLSRKKAKLTKAWDYICEANAKDTVVKGRIISKTRVV